MQALTARLFGISVSRTRPTRDRARRPLTGGALTSWLELAPMTALMALFVVVPIAAMTGLTFFKSGLFGIEPAPTLANYGKLVGDEMYGIVLFRTLCLAIAVTALVLTVSFPIAYWLAKRVRRNKMLLLLLVFVPYWVSYVVRTYAWLPLLGNSGVINHVLMSLGIVHEPVAWLLYNEFSVTLVMTYVFLPFGIVPLYLSLERIDDNLLRASADLGATAAETFRRIVVPLAMPGLAGATLTVFVLAIGSYVTPKLVGGPSALMFGNLVADQFGATFNWTWGATLALTLAVVTLLVGALMSRRIPIARVFLQG
jgi:spermidine/putrescine transport system permease protein